MRHDRVGRSPLEANRLAVSIADREADALIDCVRQQGDDATAARIEIDLDDVSLGVAEEAGLVALLSRRVIETRFRKTEYRLDARLGCSLGGANDKKARQREKP